MATNKYFNLYGDSGQQRVYKDLINEVVKQFGIDATYLPRESESHEDHLFGDDPTKKFENSYMIEVFILNTENFEGGDLFSKFGYTINKQVRLLMPAEAFNHETQGAIGSRPREGDLVWMKNFKALYEIKFVNQDKFFYAFGSNTFYGYELVCEEFRYNNEKIIDSGVDEIDEKLNEITVGYEADMGSGSGTYEMDEMVYQGPSLPAASSTAAVAAWNVFTKKLVLKNIIGVFLPNVVVTGASSGTSYVLDNIEIQENVNNEVDNNVLIRAAANTDLDVTESNPLGNPIR